MNRVKDKDGFLTRRGKYNNVHRYLLFTKHYFKQIFDVNFALSCVF